MVRCAFLLVLIPLWAAAAPIPDGAFPGVVLDAPLQDAYLTGQAIALKGMVSDPDKADGQILFRFAPQSGEPIRVFLNLQGRRFAGYHIFAHDQAGAYALEVFLGGQGAERLELVGSFAGLRLEQGSGPIVLPADFFPGVVLDAPLATEFSTGEGISLAGEVVDPGKAGGQLLFDFVSQEDGEEIQVYIDLEGIRFRRGYAFQPSEAGAYELEVYLGGAGDSSLSFLGRFPVFVRQGSGPGSIPADYFAGVVFDQSLPAEWPVERDFWLEGSAAEGVRAVHLEIEGPGDRVQRVLAPVEGGRFRVLLRLGRPELGPLTLRLYREGEDQLLLDSGVFSFRAVEPLPSPSLVTGALGLSLRPGEELGLLLLNQGEAPLEGLRYEVEGPFSVLEGPQVLRAGEEGEVRLRYQGQGGEHGWLRVFSNDPERPRRQVALHGLREGEKELPFLHQVADVQGRLLLDLDLDRHEYALVLYAGEVASPEVEAVYPFALGGPLPAARPVAASGSRPPFQALLRRREQELAGRYQQYQESPAKKAAVEYQVGDKRPFVFPGFARGDRRLEATAVAVAGRAVAWVQDDLRPHADNIDSEGIAALLEQFSRQDYERMVELFGPPSDVDGDGRLSFLFTHLVDEEEGLAGFYSASSVLPEEAGGDGNRMDLMFISPIQDGDSYRSLLVHEFQHLINFNQHVLLRRGQAEESWLNEGLSHLAEDLVAGYAASGQMDNVAAYLKDPEAVGLAGEALDDERRRGAAYLFVRSLVDRMGEPLLLRLVGTGLAGRANVEEATGESMDELLAFWAVQLYASGLGLNGHPRFNFASPLLRAGEERGFPLPATRLYRPGGPVVQGQLAARGVGFARVEGRGQVRVAMETDPRGRVGAVVVPLERGFVPEAFVPAEYVPGLRFERRIPAALVAGRQYPIGGQVLDGRIEDLLFHFVGPDTLRFDAEVREGGFSQTLAISTPGAYELQVFAGQGGAVLDFVVRFAPVWVQDAPENTAVAGEEGGLPQTFALGPAFPNPFNEVSVLPLEVPQGAAQVVVEVYNELGQKVRTLHRGALPAGQWRLNWDGRDENGEQVASGVYVYWLRSGEFSATRRAVLLR